MNVVPYKAEHLMALKLQAGQEYCLPYVTDEYARMLEGQFAFTAIDGDVVIAVGGVAELWENRALAWSFIDHRAGKYFTQLHKAVLRVLEVIPYRRIEAETSCDFEQGHRWLKMLGFELEAPRMKAFRVDGGDSALYARVKPWQ
jgi:hypothetical protein